MSSVYLRTTDELGSTVRLEPSIITGGLFVGIAPEDSGDYSTESVAHLSSDDTRALRDALVEAFPLPEPQDAQTLAPGDRVRVVGEPRYCRGKFPCSGSLAAGEEGTVIASVDCQGDVRVAFDGRPFPHYVGEAYVEAAPEEEEPTPETPAEIPLGYLAERCFCHPFEDGELLAPAPGPSYGLPSEFRVRSLATGEEATLIVGVDAEPLTRDAFRVTNGEPYAVHGFPEGTIVYRVPGDSGMLDADLYSTDPAFDGDGPAQTGDFFALVALAQYVPDSDVEQIAKAHPEPEPETTPAPEPLAEWERELLGASSAPEAPAPQAKAAEWAEGDRVLIGEAESSPRYHGLTGTFVGPSSGGAYARVRLDGENVGIVRPLLIQWHALESLDERPAPRFSVGDVVEVTGSPYAGYWTKAGAYGPVVEIEEDADGNFSRYKVDTGRPEKGEIRQTLGWREEYLKPRGLAVGDRVMVDYCRSYGTDYVAFLSWAGPGTVEKVGGVYGDTPLVSLDHGDTGAFSTRDVSPLDETPGVPFRMGDTVVYDPTDDSGTNAKRGAVAVVTADYAEGDLYLFVAWDVETLKGKRQNDGGYSPEDFRRIAPAAE